MSLRNDLISHFERTDIVDKIIYINLFIYLISLFFSGFVFDYFTLPSDFASLLHKPWVLVTYSFIHGSFVHIFVNLVILYYLGSLFLDFFKPSQFVTYYLSGIIAGGLGFILFYRFAGGHGTLVGASAAVTAIMTGIAVKIPHYALKLRFVGSVEIWVLTLIWIGISVLGLSGINAGGAVAHLGGALAGFVLTYFLHEGVISFRRKEDVPGTPFVEVYRNPRMEKKQRESIDEIRKERILNEILEKIHKSGYDSLTGKEKEFLLRLKDDD